jgi:hypothetical protein
MDQRETSEASSDQPARAECNKRSRFLLLWLKALSPRLLFIERAARLSVVLHCINRNVESRGKRRE